MVTIVLRENGFVPQSWGFDARVRAQSHVRFLFACQSEANSAERRSTPTSVHGDIESLNHSVEVVEVVIVDDDLSSAFST